MVTIGVILLLKSLQQFKLLHTTGIIVVANETNYSSSSVFDYATAVISSDRSNDRSQAIVRTIIFRYLCCQQAICTFLALSLPLSALRAICYLYCGSSSSTWKWFYDILVHHVCVLDALSAYRVPMRTCVRVYRTALYVFAAYLGAAAFYGLYDELRLL